MASLKTNAASLQAARTKTSASHTAAIVRVRSVSAIYLRIACLALFFASFSAYIGKYFIFAVLASGALLLIPAMAFTDRVAIDGKRIYRVGLPAWFASLFRGTRIRLKFTEIEQVETQAMRTYRRGWNISYRYRTSFHGKGLSYAISSGHKDYRKAIRAILPNLPECILDYRSIEVRDYFIDHNEVRRKADDSQIPAVDVLEGSLKEIKIRRRQGASNSVQTAAAPDEHRLINLRQLANELRLSGALLRAAEAFRRAVLIAPGDARLLFDFARCLHSIAGAERDARIERRASAMMRLAEKRAGSDGDLLARIGESYFQAGDWKRAGLAFQKVLDAVGESFLAVRGMAELALREGKIAHVIHKFSAANRMAETSAQRRWTQSEVEYFSRLNSDEEYMDLEIGRMNLLETMDRSRKTAVRAAIFGLPAIAFGLAVGNPLIANAGWAIAIVGLAFWTLLRSARRLFETRLPFDIGESE